jgi:diguanylate cyclase (GGDEF)-like protein
LGARWLSPRLGIAAHLGLAFAAVIGLAIAANLLIEREISVTRTTRVVEIMVPAPHAPVATATPKTAALPPPPVTASPKSLVAALEQYVRTVRRRLEIRNDDSEIQLAAMAQELERETQAYAAAPSLSGSSVSQEKLLSRLAAMRSHGKELVLASDERQSVLKEFWERFDALDARTKASLAGSWKIFGRVVARKTLVDLNSSLDEIRRGFASLPPSALFDRGALDAVVLSETALTASLAANEGALTHSQGESWVSQTRADVAQIKALQDSLVVMDSKRRDAEAELVKEALGIKAAATVKASVPRTDSPRPAQQQNTDGISGDGTRSLVAAAALETAPLPKGSPTTHDSETTSTSEQKPRRFGVIFWVSAGSLLMLLWVSIHTVLSVVRPVRRLRAATLKIAGGAARVQVKRGGIRELDDLAISFNQMAEQLGEAKAAAHHYQGQLEARVSMRTRELQHLAEHDPLTQLPNRRQLLTHLTASIARAEASGSRVGVFFVDLDNFKNINDSLGHAFGDRVLGEIAARLRVTTDPAGFAARLGGDEFTIVCDAVSPEDVVRIGQSLVGAFSAPLVVDGRHLMISISAGASMYPDHGVDTAALLQAADAALFRAKALGRSQLIVFSPALLAAASAKFTTEQGLRYALERGEFELAFQPEIEAATLTVHMVEALLRWRMPDGRFASPSEFLSIAEESGLIMEISDWVLRTSIETASRWHHGAWPQARVAINLSSRQLLDTRFLDRVKGLLQEHRLPARCIEIELTENVLQTGSATIGVLRELRELGIAIALDDFGIGYSSLASLEQLPLTRVKLDRALIAGIHSSPRSAAIARALVGLCHSIGLGVTAEGIECPEQLSLLMSLKPIWLQGYLLARPVSEEEVLAVMAGLPEHMAGLLLLCASEASPSANPRSASFAIGAERVRA